MAACTPKDVRNVVLVGHADAGKTTLAEHIMARTGALSRVGSVKEGTSHFDHKAEEKEKGHSIDLATGHCAYEGCEIHLLDTPGYPDYFGEVVSGYRGSDLALVCISAVDGVQVNTRRSWALGRGTRHARAIVVTKCDAMKGRLSEVLDGIRARFGERCIPWNAPEEVGDHTEAWTEAVVEADEELMTRYLDGDKISIEELDAVAKPAVVKSKVVPVLFVSAETGEGVDNLLEFIRELGPSPVDAPRKLVKDDDPEAVTELAPDPDAPFVGVVWNVRYDRHVGKQAFIQVAAGTLAHGAQIWNVRAQKKEKAGHLFRLQGKDHDEVQVATPGQTVVVNKVDSLKIGDTVATEHLSGVHIRSIVAPTPMYSLAVEPAKRGDEAKVAEVLGKLAEESPCFTVHREIATHELVASGVSKLHLDTIFHRAKEEMGLDVTTHTPRVPYRETLLGASEGHYRHKKQSGGRGQFAEVKLKVEPAEEGAGLVYAWEIFGGSIPRNFEPAIEKGIREKMTSGILAGFPLSDVKVTVLDGSFHDVDSSEAAFKLAGGQAFAEAAKKAKPTVLEPLVKLEISVPNQHFGDVSGDLNTRRGHILGMDQEGETQVIHAEMPLAEAAEYPRALTALTSGEGSFSMEPSRYAPVPAAIKKELAQAFENRGHMEAAS